MAPDPYAAADAAMVARCLTTLEHLADAGMEMVADLPRKAAGLRPYGAEKYEAEIASLIARAYKDVATPVQTSIALQVKLMDKRRQWQFGRAQGEAVPVPVPDEASAAEPAPGPAGAEVKSRAPRRRDPVSDLVGNLFRGIDRKLITGDLLEKLANLDQEPTGVMLAKLAKALELEVDWPKFVAEQWTHPEIEARDPRSPFAFIWDNSRWTKKAVPSTARYASDPPDRGGLEPGTPPPD